MGLISLYRAINDAREMKVEADIILKESIKDSQVVDEYTKWRTNRLNTTVYSAFIAKQFCKLEGIEFDEEKRRRVYLGAAAACISDDLIDKTSINPKELYFFNRINYPTNKINGEQEFFYTLSSGLERLLPEDFESRFERLIGAYNYMQEQGRKLNGDISSEEIIKIKNGTGGYPFLLLYRIIFPEGDDLDREFMPCYSPEEMLLPATKDHAIFNYGAMHSRLDDLDDLEVDKAEGRKSLATEGLITWRSFKQDIKYVRECFRRFYPNDRVYPVMNIHSSWSMHLVSVVGDIIMKISKIK